MEWMTPMRVKISIRAKKSWSKTERTMMQWLRSRISSDESQTRLAPPVLLRCLPLSLFLVADTPTHDCIAWFKAYGLNEAIIASLSMLAQPVKCTEPRQTTTKQNQPNLTELPDSPWWRCRCCCPAISLSVPLGLSRSLSVILFLRPFTFCWLIYKGKRQHGPRSLCVCVCAAS